MEKTTVEKKHYYKNKENQKLKKNVLYHIFIEKPTNQHKNKKIGFLQSRSLFEMFL